MTPLIPMGAKPLLAINNMSITFTSPDEPDVEAVRQVDLTLTPGKTLTLVGESGCGKSVTARAVLRLLDSNAEIRTGTIQFDADSGPVDITRLKPDSLALRAIRGAQISMIFQEPMSSLSPVHTIGDQIDEIILLHERVNRKQARERTVALLDQVGIPGARDRANAYPFELSGGLRQRAMIAMALACTPKLLIADDIAVMYLGDVVEQGDVYEVFRAPKHPYTQALMNSVPRLQRKSERTRLSPIKGTVPSPKDRPQGCAFTSRCPYAFAPCPTIRPEPTVVGSGHVARCHLLTHARAEAMA